MLLWKNQDFKSKGIIVEETPKISKGKKNIDVYTVPGRNGFLSVDNETYESFVVSVSCHFNENSNIDEIKDFLDGYGTISFDGLREYTAIIQNSISFEKVLMFKKFIVQFLVNPIAEDINYTEYNVDLNISENSLNITDATATMYPILTITGTGNVSITINNKTFLLSDIDGTYILDCKNKIITHNGINASNKMLYDFPYLEKGNNLISYIGTLTNFKIEYKKSYL